MALRGYDSWLQREPDNYDPSRVCERCGNPLEMARGPYVVWFCERCDEPEDDDNGDPDPPF